MTMNKKVLLNNAPNRNNISERNRKECQTVNKYGLLGICENTKGDINGKDY